MTYLLPQWINRLAGLRGEMATSERATRAFKTTPTTETWNDAEFRDALNQLDDALELLGNIFERENQTSEERDEPRKMPTDGWATS